MENLDAHPASAGDQLNWWWIGGGAAALVILLLLIGVLINYIGVGSTMDSVLADDPRNAAVDISAHYSGYIDPSTVVIDLQNSPDASCIDVMRVFFSFADKMQGSSLDTVILEHEGVPRFTLSGTYFHTLGLERSVGENPLYLMRTLPENARNPDGTPAFGEWTGGWLGVLGAQMKDVNSFCLQWET